MKFTKQLFISINVNSLRSKFFFLYALACGALGVPGMSRKLYRSFNCVKTFSEMSTSRVFADTVPKVAPCTGQVNQCLDLRS